MKTAFLSALCVLLQTLSLLAQSDNKYLECHGDIPKEFLSTSRSKYQEAISNTVKKGQQREEVKARKQFELESHFNLDNLLRSGRVLFNDEASVYLMDVTKVLLQTQPLKNKQTAKVYALRSSAVNAFATDRGEVFITLGLIAQLENEAQLAYIIAHELGHVEEKHNVNFYLKKEKLERSKNQSVLGRVSTDEKLFEAATYSKENENEADRTGLKRILNSPYSTATLPVVYDVLKYSYLPFDDLPFDRTLLQSEHYRLPDTYWLESVKAIEGEADDEDDSRSSHPNLKSRRQAMLETLASHTNAADKTNYAVSSERFERVRTLARNELPMLYLHADQHADAIYAAGLLLKEHPDNLDLKKCIAKSLYLNAKLKSSDSYLYEGSYEDIEGQSQQIHHLLEKLSGKESIMLAWQFSWNLHRAYPDDAELEILVKDLTYEFTREHNDFAALRNKLPSVSPTAEATTIPDSASSAQPRSKYDRIREQKTSTTSEGEADYWHYAFVGQLDDSVFVQYKQIAKQRHDQWKEDEAYFSSIKGKKELKRRQKKGLHLDIPKIAIVNPFYLKLDIRKGDDIMYIDTEEGQERLRTLIKETAAVSDLQTILIDVRDLKENQTEAFNDIRYLNEWFAEQIQHFDLTLTPGNQQERINAIAEKYGTDYFLWTGVISLRKKNSPIDILYVPLSLAVFPPLAPFALVNAIKPKHEMLQYAILYDVRTGRRQVLKFDTFKLRGADSLVKAHLYDAFIQIKRKPKA